MAIGVFGVAAGPGGGRGAHRPGCRAAVTGASRGVGFYAARALARAGCDVVVVGARRLDGLREAARRIEEETGARVHAAVVDLRVPEAIEAFVESALRQAGRLDVFVASYGNPSCEPCTLDEARWDDWVEAFKLYAASTAALVKLLASRNPAQARFIAVTSFTVKEYHRFLVVADAARAALPVIIRAAAREYAPKVIPVLLVLGSIDTPGARATVGAIAQRIGVDPSLFWAREVEQRSPLGRTMTPTELEETIAFLARAPEYMAGGVVYLEGASSACYP